MWLLFCIAPIWQHTPATSVSIHTVYLFKQVFPPEDSGSASKGGLLQGPETHQEESQQPQRQDHQHPIPQVNREVHRTERYGCVESDESQRKPGFYF